MGGEQVSLAPGALGESGVPAEGGTESAIPDVNVEELMKGQYMLSPGDDITKVTGSTAHLISMANGSIDEAERLLTDLAGAKHKAGIKLDGKAAAGEADPEAEMWQKMHESDFFFGTSGAKGNPIAGRWARYITSNPDVKAEYDQVKGAKQKTEFRASWAKAKFEEYTESKSHTKTSETIDTNSGSYFPLARIAQEEGGHFVCAMPFLQGRQLGESCKLPSLLSCMTACGHVHPRCMSGLMNSRVALLRMAFKQHDV
jgi:hypothetical protein